MEAFWPGGVTIIFRADTSVAWDLGDTAGTVALRMPNHDIALDLLGATGPLAVSSANKTGEPSARTVEEAVSQLGDSVSVYLDGGVVGGGVDTVSINPGSTIIDASVLDSGGPWRVVRHGVQSVESLRVVARGEWKL
jgi:tRNA threonylcarbamoyl adenosine modification protein (Sua5/YciO/YrdC/YwlC family)